MDPRLKTAAWRKARASVLADEPLCEPCLQRDRITPAQEVDHITPRRDAPEEFLDRTNLWGLCSSCHRIKSRLECMGIRYDNRHDWARMINAQHKPKR